MFLIMYDGATNLVTAEVVQDKEESTRMSLMTEYFEKYQMTPRVVAHINLLLTAKNGGLPQQAEYYTCCYSTRYSMVEQSTSCRKVAETLA